VQKHLSAFFEATRDEYYKQLYNVSSKGTWHEWLIYFLNGVAVQSEDVLSRAERINELLNQRSFLQDEFFKPLKMVMEVNELVMGVNELVMGVNELVMGVNELVMGVNELVMGVN
jgi:Fic family protein